MEKNHQKVNADINHSSNVIKLENETKKIFEKKSAKNQQYMLRSFNLNSTLDNAFGELKKNLRNEAEESDLKKLVKEVNEELYADKTREQCLDEFDCTFQHNYRTLISPTKNKDNQTLHTLIKKINDEEKKINDILKHQKKESTNDKY